MYKTADFDYNVPAELIAHEPAQQRDGSRLLILDCHKKAITHKHFYDLIDYLEPGDLVVLNDTKVIPARLFAKKEGGGAKIEVLLVGRLKREEKTQIWRCLVKPGKRLKVGARINFGIGKLQGVVREKLETGEQIIEFKTRENFWSVIHKLGEVPLPPYVKPLTPCSPSPLLRGKGIGDRGRLAESYQTIFAQEEGASAAPTAGLHFTHELLEKIKSKGIDIATITLHTGLSTFQPVRCEEINDHRMQAEYFDVPEETIAKVERAERVVAVGTTVVRALESICDPQLASADETDLFIYPGYGFKVVDAMVTNFHWPKSTLIMLVSAFVQDVLKSKDRFAGRDLVMKAYNEAMKHKYRFFSFGDAMLIV